MNIMPGKHNTHTRRFRRKPGAAACAAAILLALASPSAFACAEQAEPESELAEGALTVPDAPDQGAEKQTYILNFRYADSVSIVLVPDSEEDAENGDGARGTFYHIYDSVAMDPSNGIPYVIRDGKLYLEGEEQEEGGEYWGVITDVLLLPGEPMELISGQIPEGDALFEAQLASHTEQDGRDRLQATVWFHEDGTFQYANFLFAAYNSGEYRMENGYILLSPGSSISGDALYVLDGNVYPTQYMRRSNQDTP